VSDEEIDFERLKNDPNYWNVVITDLKLVVRGISLSRIIVKAKGKQKPNAWYEDVVSEALLGRPKLEDIKKDSNLSNEEGYARTGMRGKVESGEIKDLKHFEGLFLMNIRGATLNAIKHDMKRDFIHECDAPENIPEDSKGEDIQMKLFPDIRKSISDCIEQLPAKQREFANDFASFYYRDKKFISAEYSRQKGKKADSVRQTQFNAFIKWRKCLERKGVTTRIYEG
jgi:hypothetical protein